MYRIISGHKVSRTIWHRKHLFQSFNFCTRLIKSMIILKLVFISIFSFVPYFQFSFVWRELVHSSYITMYISFLSPPPFMLDSDGVCVFLKIGLLHLRYIDSCITELCIFTITVRQIIMYICTQCTVQVKYIRKHINREKNYIHNRMEACTSTVRTFVSIVLLA